MADKERDDFKAWLSERGFNEDSVSKLLKEDFSSHCELGDLTKEDIRELNLTIAQRKVLEKVVAELKSSARQPGIEETVKDTTAMGTVNTTRNAMVSGKPDFRVKEMKMTGITGGNVNTFNMSGIVYGDVGSISDKKAQSSHDVEILKGTHSKPVALTREQSVSGNGADSLHHESGNPRWSPYSQTTESDGTKMKVKDLCSPTSAPPPPNNLTVTGLHDVNAQTAIGAGIWNGDAYVKLKLKLENAATIFERTRAYQKVLQILEDNGHVVIAGSPGSGKTTMSLYLMNEYSKKKFCLRYEENIKEFNLGNVDLQKNTLLVFDDVFGTFSLTQDANLHYRPLFKDLEDYFTNIKFKLLDKQRNNEVQNSLSSKKIQDFSLKVIFCTRTNILNDISHRIKRFKEILFNKDKIVDLTSLINLNQDEKKRILVKHLRIYNISISPYEIDAIASNEYATLGFPFICQLFVANDRHKYGIGFFENPLHYLDMYVSDMFGDNNSQNTAAMLLFMLLNDGELDLSKDTDVTNYSKEEADDLFKKLCELTPQLERGPFLQKIRQEAENQVGTLLVKEGDLARFCHPTIHDAIGYVVGMKNHCFVLRNCSLKFITERVRVGEFSNGNDYDFTIKLHRQSVNILIQRLALEVTEGNFALALSHCCLREAEYVKDLMKIISTKGKLSDILHRTDDSHGLSFLFWSTFTGNDSLCSLLFGDLLPKIVFNKQEALEGLLGTCMSGNHQGLKLLLKHYSKIIADKIHSVSLSDILQNVETKDAYRQIASTYNKDSKETSIDLDVPRMHGEKRDKLIHIAAANGYIDIVTTLIDEGIEIDSTGGTDMTPLMYACYLGYKDLAERLLHLGADFSLLDEENDNCLHLASRAGFVDVAELLINAGIDINCRGFHHRTAIMFASQHGKLDVVKFLLEKDALTEPDITNVEYKDNCLHLAAREGQVDIVKFLIEEGKMSIENGGELSRTPLMVACRHGRLETVQYLVSKGANQQSLDKHRFTSLHLAATGGHNDMVTWLLESTDLQSVDTFNIFKRTPLMYAFKFGHSETVDLLLEKGADGTLRDVHSNACIHFAAQSGITSLVQHCLHIGQDANSTNDKGVTPLMNAFSSSSPETVEFLLEKGADGTFKDNKGNTCIHFAALSGSGSLIQRCLRFGQHINCKNKDGVTPFLKACQYGVIPMIRFLIDIKADVTLTDEKGKSCSHAACYGGHMDVVEVLMDNNIFDINSLDRCGESPFITAVKSDKAPLVKYLLLTYPFLRTQLNEFRQNALHVACRFGASNTVVELIQAGIDVNAQDNDMRTPLMFAVSIRKSIVDVVRLLVMAEADTTLRDSLGATCLHTAIKTAGHISMTEALLDMDADINIRGAYGESPLMLACRRNANEYFDLLLNKGANVKLVDNKRATALHHVCMAPEDDAVMVSRLLEKDPACVNRSDMHGRTPAWHAVRNGKVHTLRQLISKGANLCLFDKRGSSLLHTACKNDRVNLNIVRILVDNGANVNCRNRYGQTPVMLAAQNGHDEAIEILVVKGADLRIVDVQNLSPIDHAKMNKHYHVAGKLQVTVYRQLYPRRYFRRY